MPAATGDGDATVFLVDPIGRRRDRSRPTSAPTSSRCPRCISTASPSDGDALLGAVDVTGRRSSSWITDRAVAGLCAIQAGVCEAALRTTANYTSEREQFGMKIATFQAVAHRAADAYIDTEAIRLTACQAAWRLAEGRPAAEALAIAKFWAAEGAQRVVHAAQHLHGGIGIDVDYPVHRCFRWAKQVELSLGGGTAHLRRLGDLIASA